MSVDGGAAVAALFAATGGLPLVYVLCLVASYFVCGIPFGLVFSRLAGTADVRTKGSGNIGSTNVVREVGAGAGIATFVCDTAKGWLATWGTIHACAAVAGCDVSVFEVGGAAGWMGALAFLVAVCGHILSPYLHFHGGKGIATGFGAALGYCWPVALLILAVFALIAVPTRLVSLGSICAAASLPVWVAVVGVSRGMLFPGGVGLAGFWAVVIPFIAAAALVIWAHRSNIIKLHNHTEATFAVAHKAKPAKGKSAGSKSAAAGGKAAKGQKKVSKARVTKAAAPAAEPAVKAKKNGVKHAKKSAEKSTSEDGRA